MKKAVVSCPNCNALIHVCMTECPWCGEPSQSIAEVPGLRKRWTLGALITVMTLAALLLWLISRQEVLQRRKTLGARITTFGTVAPSVAKPPGKWASATIPQLKRW